MSVEGCKRSRKDAPERHSRPPKVCCVIDLNAIAPSARDLLRRMKANEAARGVGSYLYVEPSGAAYILADDTGISLDWIKSHFGWLVGFYTKFGTENRGLAPTVDGIVDDLSHHLTNFKATDGREYVGCQQTGAFNSLQPATGVAALQRSEAGLAVEGDNSASGGGCFVLEFGT